MILGCGHDDDGDDDDGDDEEEEDDDDHCDGGDGDTASLSPIFPWNKLICRGGSPTSKNSYSNCNTTKMSKWKDMNGMFILFSLGIAVWRAPHSQICFNMFLNLPACRRVLWILLVRSCTVCFVFVFVWTFPLAPIFVSSNLNPPSPLLASSFLTLWWAQLCPHLAQHPHGFAHLAVISMAVSVFSPPAR